LTSIEPSETPQVHDGTVEVPDRSFLLLMAT
jgi:hypothetical protein